MDSEKNIPKQRALVLQGGGSIGAYEAGVFNVCTIGYKKTFKTKRMKTYSTLLQERLSVQLTERY